jgi:hypothetical protein
VSERADVLLFLVKREAGESPARSRRCKGRVLFGLSTELILGKENKALRPKPEYLPERECKCHVEMVRLLFFVLFWGEPFSLGDAYFK